MLPRRSILFLPGSNARAIEKARGLDCDCIIFDLEDAVAPDKKVEARSKVQESVQSADYGYREKVVRINTLESNWGIADANAFAEAPVDAILLPKVESLSQVEALAAKTKHPIWCNIETAKGVLRAQEIASHPSVHALIAGTNDLSAELNIRRTSERTGLLHSLSHMILAARANGKLVFDGTFTDISDIEGLRVEARQGRILGFDGKTLIHPSQIETANQVFAPSEEEIAEAQSIVSAYTLAMDAQQAVATVAGKMIEKLHFDQASRLLQLATRIREIHPSTP